MIKDYNKFLKNQPTNKILDEKITIRTVANRCVYLHDHRVVGSEPYTTENLPQKEWETSVRSALQAFSVTQLESYLDEHRARKKYLEEYNESNILEK